VIILMALVTVNSFGRNSFRQCLRTYVASYSGYLNKRDQNDEMPVFQYVGKHRKPHGKVFVWGFTYTGALGIPSFVVPNNFLCCLWVWLHFVGLQFQRPDQTPSPVPLPLRNPQETRVLQVSCGRAHSLVLTDSEGVFSFGNNAYGQCGRKIVEDEVYSGSHVFHNIEGFDSRVCCGQDHSLFLTEQGSVFSCGWGADGQTGLGHHNKAACPVPVGGDLTGVQVQQVATFGDCSLAVSKDGQLFGWGNSEYLQLASVTESTQ
ncbi:hypothetical protein DNTS_006594, partial [Danionella cerebrum]